MRRKPPGLKLKIPETKVSPRDWSLPYQKPTTTKWSYSQEKVYRAEKKFSWRRYNFKSYSRLSFNTCSPSSSGVSSGIPYSASPAVSPAFPPLHHGALTQRPPVHPSAAGATAIHVHHPPTSHVLTPTEQLMEDPMLSLLSSEGRRSSSGALLSPEVLEQMKNEDNDNFYLLKKDSQRRLTLVKVLQNDKSIICQQWHQLLEKDVQDLCLTEAHLHTLLDGLRSYIPEQNRASLESTLSALKEELDYDVAKIGHISMALYAFQDAVNLTLRSHSIKPHWMFALDNLVRAAVQAAITILSPELGAHLADDLEVFMEPVPQQHPPVNEPDNASTSGVSTVNDEAPALPVVHYQQHPLQHHRGPQHLQHVHYAQVNQLREENSRLLSQLVATQQNYQDLLRQNLAEHRIRLRREEEKAKCPDPPPQSSSPNPSDPELVAWLKNLNLNEAAVQRFVDEDMTMGDVAQLVSKDDLRRLGLKTGPELRVWKAILALREQQQPAKTPARKAPSNRK